MSQSITSKILFLILLGILIIIFVVSISLLFSFTTADSENNPQQKSGISLTLKDSAVYSAYTPEVISSGEFIYSKSSGTTTHSKSSRSTSQCTNDSDCANSYYSKDYCDNLILSKDLHYFECIDKKCIEKTTMELVNDCTSDECGEWNEGYCLNGSVYHSRGCFQGDCSNNACIKNSYVEEELLEECVFGCENSSCIETPDNLIIMQMDDSSAWWNTNVSDFLVEVFHAFNINLVVEVAPANLNNDITFLSNAKKWSSYDNIEIAQGFYADENFTPPQDNLDYNQTRQNLQLGKSEFSKAGIPQPFTYIPAWAYGTSDTLDALRDEDFHTEMDYATAPEQRNGINKKPLVIDKGFLIIDINSSLKSETEIKNAVDKMIEEKGFANLAFHHQDFSTGVPDSEKINNLIEVLTNLKNQGYNFIRAEQYYKIMTSQN